MKYPDQVVIVDPVVDNYGAEKIGRMETVQANVSQATGYAQSTNQAQISADLVVYLDPSDSYVQEVVYRLEGMLLITQSAEDEDKWYRVETLSVGRRDLTDLTFDNIQADCVKSSEIQSVS